MELADRIFIRKSYDTSLLIEYGFKKDLDGFIFTKLILNGQFQLIVKILGRTIKTDVIELSLNEPVLLYHIDGANGEFIGRIRMEVEKILLDIADKCFYTNIFKTKQAKMCIDFIGSKYGDALEFLWEKFPDNAIWRRKDNNKWYGALLTVSLKKLNFNSNEMVEIIDLRMDKNEKDSLIDGDAFLEGYHMNKNSWYTVILDGRVPDEKLQELIDKSYALAKKK